MKTFLFGNVEGEQSVCYNIHHIKKELKARLRNAESRIQNLEDLISKQASSTNSSDGCTPNLIQTGLPGKKSCNHLSLSATCMKAQKISSMESVSTPSLSLSSSTTSSFPDTTTTTGGFTFSSTTTGNNSKNFKSNNQAQNLATKRTRVTIAQPPILRTAKVESTKAKQSTLKSRKHIEVPSDSLSDISSESSSSDIESTFSDISTSTFTKDTSSSESDLKKKNHKKRKGHESNKKHLSDKKHNSKKEKKLKDKLKKMKKAQREIEKENEARKKIKAFLKLHQEQSDKMLEDYMNEYRMRKALEYYQQTGTKSLEILNELERYSKCKFHEFDCITNDLQSKHYKNAEHQNHKLEKENMKLRMNLHKIKDIVKEYKRKKELREIDEIFGSVSEKQLLEHIAVQFHDFLRTEEDISRETAYKLIDRASFKLKLTK